MMFIRAAKYFSFKNSIIKYRIMNSILNVSPQVLSIRSFSTTIQCYRIKIPVKKIDPKINVPDDPYLLSKLINKLGEQDKLEDALSIALITKKRVQSEVVWNHLINEYVKRGRVKLGIRLLNKMKKHSFIPNQHTYTILLNGIAENQTFEDNITQAKNLLEDMQQVSTRYDHVKINVIHINCLLKVCARSSNFDALIENFNELINKGDWKPNQETYTIMLNACARQGSGYEIALKLWDQLDMNPKDKAKSSNNIIIDDNLVRSMLMVCKNHGDYRKGFEIIRNVYGLKTDEIASKPSFICNLSPQTLDVILEMCTINKKYEKGIKLFDDASNQISNLSLDIYNFNKFINMCNKTGKYDKAISTIKTIKMRGLRLSIQTYDLLITSCKNNEDWTTAKYLYEEMLRNNVKVFDSRILNKMFELAKIRIKSGSLAEIKWLLNSSSESVLQNFITSMRNEDKREAYHYKELLSKIKEAYQLLVFDEGADLTYEQINLYKKFKIKLNEAKEWNK